MDQLDDVLKIALDREVKVSHFFTLKKKGEKQIQYHLAVKRCTIK